MRLFSLRGVHAGLPPFWQRLAVKNRGNAEDHKQGEATFRKTQGKYPRINMNQYDYRSSYSSVQFDFGAPGTVRMAQIRCGSA